MTFDQAQSPRLGQRTTVESTYVRMFSGDEIPEAAWPGQIIFRSDEQILQIYDGEAWENISGGEVGQLTFVGSSVPVSQNIGDVWFNTADGNRMYVARSVGADQIATGEWEVISSAAPPVTPTTYIYQQNTPPTSSSTPPPKDNDFWYELPDNKQYYYNSAAPGNHWVAVQDAGIPRAQDTADQANTTAGQKTTNFVTDGDIPVSLKAGDTWVNNGDNKKLYVARIAGADQIASGEWELSQDWLTANNTAGNAQSLAASKNRSFYTTAPPTAVAAGDIWFDTDDGFKQYRASVAGVNAIATSPTDGWWLVQDALIPQAYTTANGKNAIYYDTAPPTVPITGSAFVVNDVWFDISHGYAISLWSGTQWVLSELGNGSIGQNAIATREIDASYAYAGFLSADQLTAGNFKVGIGIAALLRTPGNQGDPGVEIDPTGIKIIGSNATSTLSPTLQEFKGQAELSNVTVKGNPTDTGGGLAMRSQGNEVSRNGRLVLSEGVTAPTSPPGYTIDWRQVQMTAFDWSRTVPMEFAWDTAGGGRWLVATAYTDPVTGNGYLAIYPFSVTGAASNALGEGLDITSGTTALSGARSTSGNWYLTRSAGNVYLTRINDSIGQISTIQVYAQNPTSNFSMTWDGTNMIVASYGTSGPNFPQLETQKFTASAGVGSNLVYNGTFDPAIPPLDGWAKTAGPGTISRTTSSPISGTASMLVSGGSSDDTIVTGTTKFSVSERMVYQFSLAVRAGASVPANFKMAISWFNGSTQLPGQASATASLPANTTTTITGTATAPLTASNAQVVITCPQGVISYVIDDVQFFAKSGLNFVPGSKKSYDTASGQINPVNGLFIGNGDYGAQQLVVATVSDSTVYQAQVYPTSGTNEDFSLGFPLPSQTPAGIGYCPTAGADLGFWTLGANHVLYHHENGNKIAGVKTEVWRAAYTYSDTTNGYETGMSPYTSITMQSRARLTITTSPLLTTGPPGTAGDPTGIGIYLNRAGTTTRTDYHTQGITTTTLPPITSATFTSASPLDVTATTSPPRFPASAPGEFRSAHADAGGSLIVMKGDGSGRIGQASWDTSGNWSGIGGSTGGGAADTYTASATASLDLTTADVDVPGMSMTISVAATTDRFLVVAAMDIRALTVNGALVQGKLWVDSTMQNGQLTFNAGSASASLRATVHQNWVLTGLSAGSHTVKLTGTTGTTNGDHRILATHTKMAAVKLVAIKGDQGPQGVKGDTGAQGIQGATGPAGPTGPTGATGATGPTGATGAQGSQGPQGIQGATGSQGPAGTPGEKWFSQSGAPASGTGIVGDWSLDTASGDIYEKTATSTWTLRGNIKGPQGATGATGPAGADSTVPGPTGPAGPTGATGATGPKGDKGDTGATGPAGPAGSGAGDVLGPASAVADDIATYNATTGKLIKDGGATIAQVRDRSTHTGTQAASTITGLPTSLPPSGSAGGSLTGTYPNPSLAAGVVGTNQLILSGASRVGLDTIAMPQGAVNMNSQKINALAAPSMGMDAVNKTYADGLVVGVTRKYAADVGAMTAGVETTITHNLGTTDVVARFRNSVNVEVDFQVRTVDANTIGITSDVAYAASAIRAVVVG